MNILFFNRSFYPDIEATGQFLTELCEDLTGFGHKITVIAGRSYHTNEKDKRFFIKKEEYKSIQIIRAHGTTFPKRLLLLRFINLGTYFLSAFFGGFLVRQKPDVVIAQTDPPILGLLGLFFSWWYRAKFIYACKDIYPEIGIVTGKLKNPFLNFLLDKINLLSFSQADKITCLGEDMKKRIVEKSIDDNKIVVIHDWADTTKLYPVPLAENPFIKKHNLEGKFVVMYSGNLGVTQDLERVIEVAKHLKERNDLKFLFIGEGVNKSALQDKAKKYNLQNVEFLPYQKHNELIYSLNAASLHLVTMQKGLAGLIVPSKVYGIMACGKPFIACVDKDSEVYDITNKFNCGVSVEPEDINSMVINIKWN